MRERAVARVLEGCDVPLVRRHDLVMFDLDGVVKIGAHAVPGAAGAIAAAREWGSHVAFVTNNASRSASDVAELLSSLGVAARPEDVVTSAQAAAAVVLDRFGAGAAVLLLGGAGLESAVADAGLRTTSDPDEAVALMSGYGPEVLWRDIMRAAVLVRDGLPYVASNSDRTIPTPDGVAPGHGVLVELISTFGGVVPTVAGKPSPPLLRETVTRVGGERPLMVGDRLDTDILGAHNVGVDSLLVMTGVTSMVEAVAAPAQLRPTHVAADLSGLLRPRPDGTLHGVGDASCGGWRAEVLEGRLQWTGDGHEDDWLSACLAAAWSWDDAGRGGVELGPTSVPQGFVTRAGR